MNNFISDTTSYGLHGLDLKLKKYIDFNNGFFIEAGANDGVTQSNTKIFEDIANWRGILIEPSLNSYNLCKKNRPNSIVYNCCLVAENYKKDSIFGDFFGGLMNSVDGLRTNSSEKIKTPARTLSSILEENNVNKIDLFSLDVEGYELNVLNGLSFERWSPTFILVEIMNHNYDSVYNFLKSKNYDLIENLSNFDINNNPNWDGTHNDYLFKIKK